MCVDYAVICMLPHDVLSMGIIRIANCLKVGSNEPTISRSDPPHVLTVSTKLQWLYLPSYQTTISEVPDPQIRGYGYLVSRSADMDTDFNFFSTTAVGARDIVLNLIDFYYSLIAYLRQGEEYCALAKPIAGSILGR